MDDEEITRRFKRTSDAIAKIKDRQARADLGKLFRAANAVLTEMSREAVECRRNKKITVRYKELQHNLETALTNLEHHITFAALIG